MSDEQWIELFRNAAESANTAICNVTDIDNVSDSVGAGGDRSTRLDLASENVILDAIRSSGQRCVVLSEEAGRISFNGASLESDPLVIIDPLDGTNNRKRNFPVACISIALWLKREPVVGVVYDLASGVCYVAARGAGAWIASDAGNARIGVSKATSAEKAFVTLIRPVTKRDYLEMGDLFFGVKTARIVVSAALEMAWVASGVTDAFVDVAYNSETKKGGIRLVDLAAGMLLVEEAGGVTWGSALSDIRDRYDVRQQTNFIGAASAPLLDELQRLRWRS